VTVPVVLAATLVMVLFVRASRWAPWLVLTAASVRRLAGAFLLIITAARPRSS